MGNRLTIVMSTALVLPALGAVALGAAGAAPREDGRIAFLRGDVSLGSAWQLGRPLDVYSMGPDGTRVRRLMRDAIGASFSPDGNRLVALKVSDRGPRPVCRGCAAFDKRASVLTVADADGASPRALAPRGQYLSAGFSRDGQGVVFVRIDRGFRKVLAYQFPTGGARPRASVLRDVRYGVHTISIDGRRQRRIATISGGLISAVAMSRDGSQVVVAHVGRRGATSLRAVSLDGTTTTIRRFIRAVGGLDFSPSGDQLAIALASRESARIYVMARRGGRLHPISSGATFDVAPIWSPDGAVLAFMRVIERGGGITDAIYRVPADGGRPQRLRNFGDVDVLPIAWQPLPDPARTNTSARTAD